MTRDERQKSNHREQQQLDKRGINVSEVGFIERETSGERFRKKRAGLLIVLTVLKYYKELRLDED